MCNFNIVKRLFIFSSWLIISFVSFSLSFLALYNIANNKYITKANVEELATPNYYQVYASLPPTAETFDTDIKIVDAKADLIRLYLLRHNSPLAPFSDKIISISEQYDNDKVPDLWRYIVAIAQCESNLGKKIPEGSYNAWGLGIPTGAKKGMEFEDWEAGITSSAKFLKKLMDRGLYSAEEWGPIYAPPSVQNGGSWAKCVNEFLSELK